MKVLAMLVGAVLVGAVVWLSVVVDLLTLWHGAGIWTLAVLAFPAFMALAVKRGWGDDEIRYRDR